MDVFRQRLEDEYDANIIITAPTVPYKGKNSMTSIICCKPLIRIPVLYRDGTEKFISNPTEFPDMSDSTTKVSEIQEPIVKASIIVPEGTASLL